ncbi:MAG: DNA translocase FtsK, partial [Oscillospiraceae bacterium]|nr:DNA translocase FtsK [Oscillospiraceae bacterium]
MATTQKKKTQSTKSSTRRTMPPAPKKPAYNAAARLSCGAVLLLLALCVTVSYFNASALFLAFFARLLKGLFGCGYYLAAPALAAAGLILLFHRGRPVILRTCGVLALVPLVGAVLDLLMGAGGSVKDLWLTGQALQSGGLVSGAVSYGLSALFGKIITGILLVLLIVGALMAALHITPDELADSVKEHARQRREAAAENEEDEDDTLPEDFTPVTQPPRRGAKRPAIDIPLDEPVKRRDDPAAAALLGGDKGSFFTKRPADVRTPAEVLDPSQIRQEEPETAPEEKKPRRRKEKVLSREEVAAAAEEVTRQIEGEAEQAGEDAYQYPPVTLLIQNKPNNYTEVGAELRNNSRRLADTLRSFGVDATAGEVVHGPSVTRYEFTLDQGVKLSKITNLADDIALALGASGVRIAPIPDKISVVGIEVPNRAVTAVRIRDVIESRTFIDHGSRVAFAIGKDIGGNNIVGDISRLPHALIAGTTGSGKSVCTNSLIVSLLYKSTPDEVRFIMVDPKMVELVPYNGIPHLLIPVVTDPKKAAGALQWAVFEMMKRYKIFSEKGVKDLAGYNALAETDPEVKKLPTVVVVIDELADLMLVAAKEVEESICRVAQMGR